MKLVRSILAAAAAVPAIFTPIAGVAAAAGALAVCSTAEASPVPNTKIVSISEPAGPRGRPVIWRIRLKGDNGNGPPLAGVPVTFISRSSASGPRAIGVATTDSNGYANLYYTVPTSTRETNIVLTAVTGGGPFTAVRETAVTITR